MTKTAFTNTSAVRRRKTGGALRPQAESPRRRFLYTDVTPPEHDKIQAHCSGKGISVSQFLAEIMLEDALQPHHTRKQKVMVRPEFDLLPEEVDKLQLLARLHGKQSIGEFIREILQPYLDMQRLHSPLETMTLRCYLSEQEHERVMRHVTSLGISARNYAAMLALRVIENRSNQPQPTALL